MVNQTHSYIDILKMDPLVFLTYLEQFIPHLSLDVDSAESMDAAGKQLGEIANAYSVLTSLYNYAGVLKRQLSRTGSSIEHQDMIDKESAVEQTMRAVDLSYRALNRAISVRIENNKEMTYTDGVTYHSNNKRGGR